MKETGRLDKVESMIGIDLEYDVWINRQIELLKAGKLTELDVTNLIEELKDLGRRERAACRSFVYQIILHKLLYDYWQAQGMSIGHWQAEISSFQFQLSDRLTTNIYQHLQEDLEKIYQKSLKAATAKSSLNSEEINFPNLCPYTLDEIIGA